MKVSVCPDNISERHVYVYNGNDYVCRYCGRVVKYDIMNRDFK